MSPQASSTSRSTNRGASLMVAGGLLLGTLGVFVEEAGAHPLTTVWCRCAFGLLALTLWGLAVRRSSELRLRWRAWGWAVAAALLMIASWALFFAAIPRTSIGVATVVFHVQPLWVLVLGAWWWRQPVTGRQWGAVLLALVGLALASGLLDEAWPADAQAYSAGLLMCLGGSLSYALVTLIAKAAREVSSFAMAWWQCLVGTLLLAAWPLLHGWPATPAAWAWLAGLGVLHTGLAYVVLYAGMALLPTHRIAVLQFVYPLAAIVVDWAVYGRALSGVQLAGAGLMALALLSLKREPAGRAPGRPKPARIPSGDRPAYSTDEG
ncbi:DMT family transporter [Piscinibacter sp. HJYY11]|uniref:DMT family transporter n=1 Tax=Piscinibacter sp. HJYY11 TaxID=2801333 RepID=UPI00191CB67D|nr:DMT family transporter [Piscinibacter sp. HJYY11]MBL0729251.1 DMT family transporter [Piscinibacter sp. HJYY11]